MYGISRGVSDGMYEQNRPTVYKVPDSSTGPIFGAPRAAS